MISPRKPFTVLAVNTGKHLLGTIPQPSHIPTWATVSVFNAEILWFKPIISAHTVVCDGWADISNYVNQTKVSNFSDQT